MKKKRRLNHSFFFQFFSQKKMEDINEGLERIGNSVQQLIREAQASLSSPVRGGEPGISVKRKYPAMIGSMITALIMSCRHSQQHSMSFNMMSALILLTTRFIKAQKPIHSIDKVVIRMCYSNKMSRPILDWIHKTNLCLHVINLVLF